MTAVNGACSGTLTVRKLRFGSEVLTILNVTFAPVFYIQYNLFYFIYLINLF